MGLLTGGAEQQLAERVYDRLRDTILAGVLRPGAPLSRRSLAEEFGVSSIPVAAALQRLETEGFVESRARAGTRVKVPTPDAIRGNYILREALETHSARLFAEVATATQRQRLRQRARHLDAAYERLIRQGAAWGGDQHVRFEKTHVAFHIRVAEGAQCRELTEAIERSRVLLFNWLFSAAGQIEPLPAAWHEQLAEALAEAAPAVAAEAMRTHVRFRREEAIAKAQAEVAELEDTRILRGPQRRTLARDGRQPVAVLVAGKAAE